MEKYNYLKKELSNLKAEPCAYTKRALLIRQNGSNNQTEEESKNQVYDELFEQVRTIYAFPTSVCLKIHIVYFRQFPFSIQMIRTFWIF